MLAQDRYLADRCPFPTAAPTCCGTMGAPPRRSLMLCLSIYAREGASHSSRETGECLRAATKKYRAEPSTSRVTDREGEVAGDDRGQRCSRSRTIGSTPGWIGHEGIR